MQQAGDTLKAAVWMIGAILGLTSMAVSGRAAAAELDTFEIMLYRSVLGFAAVLVLAGTFGTLRQVTTRNLHLQVARNISHFAGQNLWFYAITVAPLAQVFALEFTMPVWVILLAVLLLGERLTMVRIVSALIGFAGILVITRPWAAGLGPGVIPGALCAIGFAGAAVFTKLLTRTETVTCILFWLTAFQSVFGLIMSGWDGDIALPSAGMVPWVIVIAVAGLVGHYCMTQALRLAPATVVVPIDFTRLPLAAVIGMAVYAEPLEWAVLLGALLIFGGNYLNIWSEQRAARIARAAAVSGP